MSDIPKVKYRNEDGEEHEYQPRTRYESTDAEMIAHSLAEAEYHMHHPDLCDTASWPIDYEIKINRKWKKIRVGMEYVPSFSAREIKP